MAQIQFYLSKKASTVNGLTEIHSRFYHGSINQRAKTSLFVNPSRWNDKTQRAVVPRIRSTAESRKDAGEIRQLNADLDRITEGVLQSFIDCGGGNIPLEKGWLQSAIDGILHPIADNADAERSFYDIYEEFINKSDSTETTKAVQRVVCKLIKRYSLFKQVEITLDSLDLGTLKDIKDFIANEHIYMNTERYKSAITKEESNRIRQKGAHTVCSYMSCLRAFINWANDDMNRHTKNNPFIGAKGLTSRTPYGKPYYLSREEMDKLADFDLSKKPNWERQRDIFIFQCNVGCRWSDLCTFTKDSVQNGCITYIAHKTQKKKTDVVKVPLTPTASRILKKYENTKGNKLLPFATSIQVYNEQLKSIFKLAGLNRMVDVINPKSGEPTKRPLYELASSHLARRTFIGNLYKLGYDLNLVSFLSGHVHNSQAIARYYVIDDDMSKEMIDALERGHR